MDKLSNENILKQASEARKISQNRDKIDSSEKLENVVVNDKIRHWTV
jgi:hypothetical protein